MRTENQSKVTLAAVGVVGVKVYCLPDAFERGCRARREGEDPRANPFETIDFQWVRWVTGWHVADIEILRAEQKGRVARDEARRDQADGLGGWADEEQGAGEQEGAQ